MVANFNHFCLSCYSFVVLSLVKHANWRVVVQRVVTMSHCHSADKFKRHPKEVNNSKNSVDTVVTVESVGNTVVTVVPSLPSTSLYRRYRRNRRITVDIALPSKPSITVVRRWTPLYRRYRRLYRRYLKIKRGSFPGKRGGGSKYRRRKKRVPVVRYPRRIFVGIVGIDGNDGIDGFSTVSTESTEKFLDFGSFCYPKRSK